MRLLVCGGRDFTDVEFIVTHLCRVHQKTPVACLIEGGARGVDRYAHLWAKEMGIPVETYEADWTNRGSGLIRNERMLREGKPDRVMAFPGGNGTAHMHRISMEVPWIEVWQSREILFRKDARETWFMSNFADIEFYDDDGVIWPSSEHYYQAQKLDDETYRSLIQAARTPNEAKTLSKTIKARPDWHPPQGSAYGGYKEVAMRQALFLKFTSSDATMQKLLDTRDDYLVEHAPWGDSYWGNYAGGLNRLGKLLMELRDQLTGV